MSIYSKIKEFIYSTFPRFEKWHKERNGFYAIYFNKQTNRWLFESLEFKDVKLEKVKFIVYNGRRVKVIGESRYNGYIIQYCGPHLFVCTKKVIKEWHGLCDTKDVVYTTSLDEMKELLND